MGSYTVSVLCALGVALVVDVGVLRTRLVCRRGFWAAYAILLCFQLLVNGLLTAPPVVGYDSSVIVGWRIAYAPIEDLPYGFALILLTLSVWCRVARRRPGADAVAPARRGPRSGRRR